MTWTRARLEQTLTDLRRHRGDNTTIEVKRARGGVPQSLPETLCAFANMPEGGLIILGVDEVSDFSITGIADPAGMESAVASQARNAVDPAPYLEMFTIDVEGLDVVVVEVTSLPPSKKPAYFKGKAYLRQADGDYPMGPSDLHMIDVAKLHATERQEYDAQPVEGTSMEDLDDTLLNQFLERSRTSRRLENLSHKELLHQTGVLHRNGELTVAGMYALGHYPQGRLPALHVTAAVRLPRGPGNSEARSRNLQDFDGPLPALLDDLMRWISQNLSTEQIYNSEGHLRDHLEIPPRAVREAIANALVHRDLGPDTLGMGKQVEIRIDAGKLIIVNPGGLRGVTKSQLESNELSKAAVNQRLYGISKNLRTGDGARIIEGEGGGIQEILTSARKAGLQRPSLIDTGVMFKAIFWRGSAFSREEDAWLQDIAKDLQLSHVQKSMLVSLHAGEHWSPERVPVEFSPMSREDAAEELQGLIRAGLITVDRDADPEINLSATPKPSVSNPHPEAQSPGQPVDTTAPEDSVPAPGRNGPAVMTALANGKDTVSHIVTETGLSRRQVNYALEILIATGCVTMNGGRGHRNTSYAVAR